MAEATVATRLIQDYEAIRLREYELMSTLLDVLPKIDNVDAEGVTQVRDAMFHADHPFLMVLTGPFSAGKSSLINALLGDRDLLTIGVTPTTDRITILRWGEEAQNMQSAGGVNTVFHQSEMLRRVSFVDTPGLQSVFQQHEQTTRKFMHRADVVLLVMLATQAMTQANSEYLKFFKEYGKKIILVINQADLLDDDQRETVREYVMQQAGERLGYKPDVWLVSARQGLDAWHEGQRDPALWRASGLQQIEDYIDRQLSDTDRLRQKLQTPLKIVQTVHQTALDHLRENQTRFDAYRAINENIEQQLQAHKREQEAIVREIVAEVEARFTTTADRSGEALLDIFQFSRALGSLLRGLGELIPIGRLLRRGHAPSLIRRSFDDDKVFEPIDELPMVVDRLGPRIEGKDMQDLDDLVTYAQRELKALPEDMRDKVIGTVQAPVTYDRSALQAIRPDLAAIEDETRVIETEKLEQIRRNTLIYLAVWEAVIVMAIVALLGNLTTFEGDLATVPVIVMVVLLTASLAGFAAIPLRGRMIHTQFTNRLHKLQARYTELLTRAADKQIAYGMQLRRDTVLPLTRLVEAQSSIQNEQFTRMREAEQAITKIETDLNALGTRRFLGVKM